MSRQGVLSDVAIKSAYPEYVTPNLKLASAMEMVVMNKHELLGSRLPKDLVRKKITRFPINDIANYSSMIDDGNKAKSVWKSTQGYRKKLGSSNIDLEDRQSGRIKFGDKKMEKNNMDGNFELKRRGGFVDVVNLSSIMSQDEIALNIPSTKINKSSSILQMNKSIRDSKVGLQRMETMMNSEVLNNLESAKIVSIKQNALIAQDEKFRRLGGGEAYYNAQTQRDYYNRRTAPDDRFRALREGEVSTTDDIQYNATEFLDTSKENLKTKSKEIMKLSGAKNPKEFEESTGLPLPTVGFISQEETISMERKPKTSTNEKRTSFDESNLPEEPDEPKRMSKASRSEPRLKDLPKDLEGNIDFVEYIRKREEEKMTDPTYKRDEEKFKESRASLTSQKTINKYGMMPSEFNRQYRKKDYSEIEGYDVSDLTKVGRNIIGARDQLQYDYTQLSKVIAEDEYNRNEQLFEDFEKITQENLPPHSLPTF
jgi:hypothetical protein